MTSFRAPPNRTRAAIYYAMMIGIVAAASVASALPARPQTLLAFGLMVVSLYVSDSCARSGRHLQAWLMVFSALTLGIIAVIGLAQW